MGESGSSRKPEKDLPSDLRCPDKTEGAANCWNILIVEDNEADVFLIEEAILATKLPVSLHVVNDGEQAVKFIDRVECADAPCPTLVILDINLPKKRGGEVLRYMRQSSKCAGAIVIVVSTSESLRDRNEMAGLGADSYFSKPSGYADFMKLSGLIKSFLANEPSS